MSFLKNKKGAIAIGGGVLVLLLIFAWFRRPEIVKPKRGPVIVAVYSLGTVTSANVYTLKSGLTAGISELFVKEGDAVTKGSRLISLDSGVLISAPFNGTITRLSFQKGEIVMPGIPVLVLTDLANRYVTVALDQESAIRVKPGQTAEVSFESMRDRVFQGTLDRLYPQNGSFMARIKVDLPPDILPEMTADVAISTEKKENALLIPAAAIIESEVMRRRDGKKEKVRVETGASDGDWIEITNGVISDTDELLLQKK